MSVSAWWRACLSAASLATACAAQARDFVTLAPAACLPVEPSAVLPGDMEPYRASVRACPLVQALPSPSPAATAATAHAKVRLLSVFTDDYYKALPADAPWQNFPLPILVDDTGRCVGRLAHLFPVDPPQELSISAGRWQRGVPHELRLKVRSPAVGGNYALPSLHWNARAGTYAATAPQAGAAAPAPSPHTTHPSQDKTSCPPM